VIRTEHINEYFVNYLESQDRIYGLAEPENPEIPVVVAGKPKWKDNAKIYNLRQEEDEENRKLLMQLASP
jgi:hypothetical protein